MDSNEEALAAALSGPAAGGKRPDLCVIDLYEREIRPPVFDIREHRFEIDLDETATRLVQFEIQDDE